MLPGVYVASEWWNESAADFYPTPEGNSTEPGEGNYTDPVGGVDAWSDSFSDYYYVEDQEGNGYYIWSEFLSEWYNDWRYTSLFVYILLDPDGTYMSWMAGNDSDIDPWYVFWVPEDGALSGDEVFIYTSFYNYYSNFSYYYKQNFTWYDESWEVVDANEIIPVLAENYTWASWMNGTYEESYEWEYGGFGYDVSEMAIMGNTTQWMQHYFAGMSAFNDTNGNGVMDIAYEEVEYDWDEDGIVDWTDYVMDMNNSELAYDFWPYAADFGDYSLPALNADGQIEWSAEVINIEGDFTEPYPRGIFLDAIYGGNGTVYEEPETIPAALDSLEMIFRFEASDDAAILKIDQLVGDFTDPDTGEILPAAQGLGLTLNYWSGFSSWTFYAETGDGDAVPVESMNAEALPDGTLSFSDSDLIDEELLVSIEFGGTYVWGKDGQTYDVGTTVIPMWYYYYTYDTGVNAAELTCGTGGCFGYEMYYYSSCYVNWDGYSITHDPIFTVYPMLAPGSQTGYITNVLVASILIGSIGIIAMSMVCVRTNRVRQGI
jgi:hypothetical protein